MREIKFRGKDIKGNWRYGDLMTMKHFVANSEEEYQIGDFESSLVYKINKETIGQYTGLHDKNGKEIYEGDIVTGTKYPFIDIGKQNYIGIVVFYEDVAQFGYEYKCVNKDKRGISNGINNEFNANENLICEDLEVIGNIYENSNLLKD